MRPTYLESNKLKFHWISATMAQSAARKSHNLKVVSSSLTGRIVLLFGSISYFPLFISRDYEFYGVTSGFKWLIMKTKYVCQNLIGLYVNFHNNPTM